MQQKQKYLSLIHKLDSKKFIERGKKRDITRKTSHIPEHKPNQRNKTLKSVYMRIEGTYIQG